MTEPDFIGTVPPHLRDMAQRECPVACRHCRVAHLALDLLPEGPGSWLPPLLTLPQSWAMEDAGVCDGEGAGLPPGAILSFPLML